MKFVDDDDDDDDDDSHLPDRIRYGMFSSDLPPQSGKTVMCIGTVHACAGCQWQLLCQ